jgi:hypothetical protein
VVVVIRVALGTRRGLSAGPRGVAGAIALGLGLAIVLMTAPVWGQVHERLGNGWFRVTWQPRSDGVAPRIEGHVYNDSAVRVTNVRLQVEGLAADSHLAGKTFVWAVGDVVPGGETYFVVESIPRAVSYRIGVVSFDVVSGVEAP